MQVQRANTSRWMPAAVKDTLCTGDSLRVLEFGEATIRLPDATVFTVDANTSLTFAEPQGDTRSLVSLLRGIIHIISRDPRALKFSTPYANAGLEGTEFSIEVTSDETSITVLEGEVVMSNAAGTAYVAPGERGSAAAGRSPRVERAANALDVVRWASHYPPVVDGSLPGPDEAPAAARANDPEFYAARAARRLRYGRLLEARADLERAEALAPGHSTALALRAVIAAARSDTAEALRLAGEATAAAPDSVPALLALAYARQRAGDFAGALQSVERATEVEPDNATAWARLAELHLAMADYDSSVAAATRALEIDPVLAYGEAMLGFARLRQMRAAAAAEAFRRAIALDTNDPLPRVGLGLALIQSGDLEAGRRQLEIAVILDPTNSLVRSYMAKTYGAEHRLALSETQLELAKAFDPLDPTPWLYDALRKREQNEPVAALHDLGRATDLNDRRAPYRSRLLVDEDLGARSAGWGRLYRELGFEELALLRGWQAVAADPADYSAHRLLADVYSTLPRHEIARVNELFQSQLLQPINVTPIQPQLAEVSRSFAGKLGPTELAFDEFTAPLSENGIRLRGSAAVADDRTRGQDVIVAGLHDRVSYSLGHYLFETDGFRPNNDFEQSVTNAFVQFRANPDTSLLAEIRLANIESGDLQARFDPNAYIPELRMDENVDTLRVGVRRNLSSHAEILASLQYQDIALSGTSGPLFSVRSDSSAYAGDFSHLYDSGRWHVTSGFFVLERERTDLRLIDVDEPLPPGVARVTEQTDDVRQISPYVYATFAATPDLRLTIGASADSLDGGQSDRERLNPKLGLWWQPTARTSVRAAAFRTLQGPLVSRRNILPRLEPVQVAGFNQFFYGSEGDLATRYGIGVDHAFSERVSGGIEISEREIELPLHAQVGPISADVGNSDEQLRRAYLHWTPSARVAFKAEYQRDDFDNGGGLFNGFSSMKIERLPLEARYFHRSGLSVGVTGTYARQEGYFADSVFITPSTSTVYGEDSFWIFDASVGYRLPNRRGIVSLNVANLFDERFQFQDIDPENPEFLPDRTIYLRFTLAFD
ncbi:MAG TPA: FecR domain-containing protein [Gammaproteobacteria bacterium]